MAVAGLRGTGDWATDERPKNFREMILWRNPNGMAPLTALLSKMKSESTDDPEFAWYEEELNALRLTEGFPSALFSERTGLPLSRLQGPLLAAQRAELLEVTTGHMRPTLRGQRYLNQLLQLFLAAD